MYNSVQKASYQPYKTKLQGRKIIYPLEQMGNKEGSRSKRSLVPNLTQQQKDKGNNKLNSRNRKKQGIDRKYYLV